MLDKYSHFLLSFLGKNNNLSDDKHKITEEKFLLKNYSLLIRKASKNRVALYFVKEIKRKYPNIFNEMKLKEILLEGEEKQNKIFKTLEYLSKLQNCNFILFKSSFSFPTISSDIDILLSNEEAYNNFIELTKKDDFYYIQDEKFKGSLYKKNYTKIEPHLDISWNDRQFIDIAFISKNCIYKKINNLDIKVPNQSATLLISLAHIIFDCQYISLRDFIEIKKYIKDDLIVKEIRVQSIKYGWEKAFDYLIKLIENVNNNLEDNSKTVKYNFPLWIPFTAYIRFLILKIYFDFKNNKKMSLNIRNLFFSIAPYFWKRVRARFSKKIYRHSWLY